MSEMGHRFEYEAPNLTSNLGWIVFDWLTRQTTQLVWIREKASGKRIAVDEEANVILDRMADSLQRYSALPSNDRTELFDCAFDEAAAALFAKTRGNRDRYNELAAWSADAWHRWCDDQLQTRNARDPN